MCVSLFILIPFHSRDVHRSLQAVHYNLRDLRRRPILVAGRGCLVFIFCLRRFRRRAFVSAHDIGGRRVFGPIARIHEDHGNILACCVELSLFPGAIFFHRVELCTVFFLAVRPVQVRHVCVNPIDGRNGIPHMRDARALADFQVSGHGGPQVLEGLCCQQHHQPTNWFAALDHQCNTFDGRYLRSENRDSRVEGQDLGPLVPSGVTTLDFP